jgi:putative flippase GtrA
VKHNNKLKEVLFYRYLVVGIGNTVFGYSIFMLFLYIGLHYSVAVLLSTIIGILFNFYMYGRVVFKSNSWELLGKFVFFYLILYLINITLLAILNTYMVNLYIAGIIVLPLVSFLGFIFNRRYVWIKN